MHLRACPLCGPNHEPGEHLAAHRAGRPGSAGAVRGHAPALQLWRARIARRAHRGGAARAGPAAGRARAAVHAQPSRVSRADVRRLVGRPRGGPGERQAAPARSAMDRGACAGALGLRHGGRGRRPADARALHRRGRRRLRGIAGGSRRGPAGARPGRPRLAVLHQRHHRQAQGRHADPSQPDDHGTDVLHRRGRDRAPRRHRLRSANVARRASMRSRT
jgi:hypothetical protein